MTRIFVLLLFLVMSLAIAAAAFPAAGAGSGSRVAKEELIPAQFIVPRIGRTDVDVIFRKEKAYLPLVTIFNYLHIKADYSSDHTRLTGFYPDPDHGYTLDLLSGSFRIKDSSASLGSDDYTFSDQEVFLREDLFPSLFHLVLRYDPHRLSVNLLGSPKLPVMAARAREQARVRYANLFPNITPEYAYPRIPSLFEWGKVDWNLTSRTNVNLKPRSTYQFLLGGKVLGSDLDFNIRDDFGRKVTENNVHGFMRYPFENNSMLRQIILGDVAPLSASMFSYYGVEVTNRPAARRLTFGSQDVITHIPSSNEVELYERGLLLNYVPSTSDSTYNFPIPLLYGTYDFNMRVYDQWGQLNDMRFRSIVPVSMIPVNEVQYSVVGGQSRGFDRKYGSVSLQRGFTPVLSMGTGVEFFENGFTNRSSYPYVNGAVRFISNLAGEIFISPLATSRVTLTWELPNQMRFGLSHYAYNEDIVLNPGDLISSTNFTFAMPFTIDQATVGISGNVINTLSHFVHQRGFLGGVSAHFPTVMLDYSVNFSQSGIDGDYQTSIATSSPSISILAPAEIVFQGGFTYDHLENSLQSLNLAAERLIVRNLFFQVTFERTFKPSLSFINFRLDYVLPFTHLSSEMTRTVQDGDLVGPSFMNQARGVVFLSSKSGDMFFNPVNSGDRGIFLIKPFIDKNGNSRRDDGEEILPETRMNTFGQYLSAHSYSNSKGTFVTSIEPYQRYTSFVDWRNSFENPLWVPKYRAVQVTGEPNVLKVVDFPIVVGGNVSGKILLTGKGTPTPVEAMTVMLRPRGGETGDINGVRAVGYSKTTKSFSNGEFEFLGVPPGDYTISLEPGDIQALGVTAAAMSRQVTVQAKSEGDQVEGIDFEVH